MKHVKKSTFEPKTVPLREVGHAKASRKSPTPVGKISTSVYPTGLTIEDEDLLASRSEFHGVHVYVLGDSMIDEYITGRVAKASQESGCSVFKEEKTIQKLGAAANVAAAAAALGAQVTLITMVGVLRTRPTNYLLQKCHRLGIDVVPIFCLEGTTVKTRYVDEKGQVIYRSDRENVSDQREGRERVVSFLKRTHLLRRTIFLLSDYAKGFFSPRIDDVLNSYLRFQIKEKGIQIGCDPKPANIQALPATFMTPNEPEVMDSMAAAEEYRTAVAEALEGILGTPLVVTRGKNGCEFTDGVCVPSFAREVNCVVGAGDTFLAAYALHLYVHGDAVAAARFASVAAGLAVEKPYTATVTYSEVTERLKEIDSAVPAQVS